MIYEIYLNIKNNNNNYINEYLLLEFNIFH